MALNSEWVLILHGLMCDTLTNAVEILIRSLIG